MKYAVSILLLMVFFLTCAQHRTKLSRIENPDDELIDELLEKGKVYAEQEKKRLKAEKIKMKKEKKRLLQKEILKKAKKEAGKNLSEKDINKGKALIPFVKKGLGNSDILKVKELMDKRGGKGGLSRNPAGKTRKSKSIKTKGGKEKELDAEDETEEEAEYEDIIASQFPLSDDKESIEGTISFLKKRYGAGKKLKSTTRRYSNSLGYSIIVPREYSRYVTNPNLWKFRYLKDSLFEVQFIVGCSREKNVTVKKLLKSLKKRYSKLSGIAWDRVKVLGDEGIKRSNAKKAYVLRGYLESREYMNYVTIKVLEGDRLISFIVGILSINKYGKNYESVKIEEVKKFERIFHSFTFL